ncbi:MAG: fibronectin type III domain-containing protein [Candidatus Paceibacterota bacterium]|jgi:hypothetical protein
MKSISNILKINLVVLAVFFGAGFFCTPFALASDGLTVKTWDGSDFVAFDSRPLFNVDNFYPGASTSSLVKVINNSGKDKKIATETLSYPGFPNKDNIPAGDLSRYLSIVIRENGGSDLYGGLSSTGAKTLYDFYRDGETYLSTIPAGNYKEYEYAVLFPSTETRGQEATTTFDLLVGFQGEEGGAITPGNGGGGSAPLGLTIPDGTVTVVNGVEGGSVTISWTTSYSATSWVIYSKDGEPATLDLSKPNYGYASSYPNPETNVRGTSHSVTIPNLSPGTYHFRCVSHGSLAVTQDHTFTLAAVLPDNGQKTPAGGEGEANNNGQGSGLIAANSFTPQVSGTSTEIGNSEESSQDSQGNQTGQNGQGQPEQQIGETQVDGQTTNFNLMASLASIWDSLSIGACWPNSPWWLFLLFAAYPILKGLDYWNSKRNKSIIFSIISLIPIIVAILAYAKLYICLPWWLALIFLVGNIALWMFDQRKSPKKQS